MAEQLKELLKKIQEDGVRPAEEKARRIEEDALAHAKTIIDEARQKASGMIAEAGDKCARMEESGRASLKQAARDLVISLYKEIEAILSRLVVSDVRKAMAADEMAKMIQSLIKECRAKGDAGIVISMKKEDAEKTERHFLSLVKDEARHGITIKPSEEITGGFTISYDSGRSHYDFTDKGIAEYITAYLKPKLGQLFK